MRRSQGFTLIELMVVLSVIAILMVITLYGINSSRASGRNAGRQQIMTSVQTGLERFYADNKTYVGAPSWDYIWYYLCTQPGFDYTPGHACTRSPSYLPSIPSDPGCPSGNALEGGPGTWAWVPCGLGTKPKYFYEAPGIAHLGVNSPCVTNVAFPQAYQLVLEKEAGGVSFYCSP